MSDPARRPATYDDLLRIPEGIHAEIIDGEIYTFESGLPRHSLVSAGLTHLLFGPYSFDPLGPGGWWILPEIDFKLSRHDVVRPDLAGWRRARLLAFPEERPIRLVPDWICEILSPSNARHDLVTKATLYARSGVPYYWIVDPGARVLEAFRLQDPSWLRLGAWGDGDRARVAPFEEVEIEISRLFPPPLPGELVAPTTVSEAIATYGEAR